MELKETNTPFLKIDEIVSRDFYAYYKMRRREVAPKFNQYRLFVKGVAGLLYRIKLAVAEMEGGFYMEGVGYFYAETTKTKKKKKTVFDKQEYKKTLKFKPVEEFKQWDIEFNNLFSRKKGDVTNFMEDEIISFLSAKKATTL